jgi:O-antigen ligase
LEAGGVLMVRDALLVLGLLLSTASQLRPRGIGIGFGEICLALWLMLSLAREVARLGPTMTPALSRLLIFWLLFAIAQSVGTLTALAIADTNDSQLVRHDIMAYSLAAAVSLVSAAELDAGSRLHRVAWLLVLLGSASLAFQLTIALGLIDIFHIDPWYWDRLRGWSTNPNQLALLCAVLGLLSLHLADTASRLGERIAAILCAVLPVYVGRLTKSDTFGLTLLAAGAIFIALKVRTWLLSGGLRSASAWIFIFALPAVLVLAVPFVEPIASQAGELAKDMAKGKSQDTERTAQLRFHSWNETISRGLESGMLGLGPGPHLEIPPSVVAARMLPSKGPQDFERPQVNNAPNFEAHNTLLDLFVQGGLIAVLTLVWLVATTLAAAYRARLDGLTTLLFGLAVFSIFHLIVRHPIFWFAIAFCLVTTTVTRGPSAVRNWS